MLAARARRLRRKRRQLSRQRLTCSRTTVPPAYSSGTVTATAATSVPDPRVDHCVGDVDGEVRESDHGRVHCEHADDDVVVMAENALHEFLAQPRYREDGLDHYTAGDDADDQWTQDRRHWD